MSGLEIAGRPISALETPYIIAELSANHGGSLRKAKETIKAAKLAGADAIKIQSYTPDTMTLDSDKQDFQITSGLWEGRTLYDLYTEAFTPFEWHPPLFKYAKQIGIPLFSSPFDETAVALLASLDAPAFKIASFELTDLPLITCAASVGKPLLMSTGMASFDEIGEAVETARRSGCSQIGLFHCISSYPASLHEANLIMIQRLKAEFSLEVGLSDHTIGHTAAIATTALGGSIIEKHFKLDESDSGPDSSFSATPKELAQLVRAVRDTHSSLGQSLETNRTDSEKRNMIFRRSLYFSENIKQGETIQPRHIRRIRPGFGLAPKYYSQIIGKKLVHCVERGDRVAWDCFDDPL